MNQSRKKTNRKTSQSVDKREAKLIRIQSNISLVLITDTKNVYNAMNTYQVNKDLLSIVKDLCSKMSLKTIQLKKKKNSKADYNNSRCKLSHKSKTRRIITRIDTISFFIKTS